MMGKPCIHIVRYIMYVISMMGKPCTLYNVRYINDGKTMHMLYVI